MRGSNKTWQGNWRHSFSELVHLTSLPRSSSPLAKAKNYIVLVQVRNSKFPKYVVESKTTLTLYWKIVRVILKTSHKYWSLSSWNRFYKKVELQYLNDNTWQFWPPLLQDTLINIFEYPDETEEQVSCVLLGKITFWRFLKTYYMITRISIRSKNKIEKV